MALEKIIRRGYSIPDIAEAENKAIESVLSNPDKHINAYLQDERSFSGRYVCTDLFKETFADTFAVSRETRGRYNGAVHNSAAVLAAEQFRRVLANDNPEQTKAVFLTGSPGAGKTSSVLASGDLDPTIRVLFEGQLSTPKTSIEKIQQALNAGLEVQVIVVHPSPENALDNTLKRYYQEGRGANIDVMAKIQGGLPTSLEAIHGTFGDAVSLTVIDRRDFNNSIELPGWEHLPVLSSEGNYEQIKKRLKSTIDKYLEQGVIDNGAYQQATGESVLIDSRSIGSRIEQNAERRNIPRRNSQEGILSSFGDELLEYVQEIEREQHSLLESITQTYQELLAVYIEAKHDQVERLEERLEQLIDYQQCKLQQTQDNPPGLFSWPDTKKAWQTQQATQQARLQTLNARLELVHEISNEMGVYAPRIEELATRKLRAQEPDLATEWDRFNSALRHQELQEKQQQVKKNSQSMGLSLCMKKGHD